MKRIIEVNLIAGLWLISAPFVLAHGAGQLAPLSNDVAVGVLLVACSLWVLTTPIPTLGVIAFEAACGLWLIVAPFAFQERGIVHALRNDVVVGAFVLLISLANAWIATGARHHAA